MTASERILAALNPDLPFRRDEPDGLRAKALGLAARAGRLARRLVRLRRPRSHYDVLRRLCRRWRILSSPLSG